MSDIRVTNGEIFVDSRGSISSLNNFRFNGVKRVYFIRNADISILRGWHGHRLEQKWFYCVQGDFTIGLVKVDDWETPDKTLKPSIYHLTDTESKIMILLHFVKKQSQHSRNPCAVKLQSGINGSATPAVLWTDFIPFAA